MKEGLDKRDKEVGVHNGDKIMYGIEAIHKDIIDMILGRLG